MSTSDKFVSISEAEIQKAISEIRPCKCVFVVVDLANGFHPSFDFHFRDLGDGLKLVSVIHGPGEIEMTDHFVLKMDDSSFLGFSVVLSLDHCRPAEVTNVGANFYEYDSFVSSLEEDD